MESKASEAGQAGKASKAGKARQACKEGKEGKASEAYEEGKASRGRKARKSKKAEQGKQAGQNKKQASGARQARTHASNLTKASSRKATPKRCKLRYSCIVAAMPVRSTYFSKWRNFCSSASLTFPVRVADAVPGPCPLALPLPPSRLIENGRLPPLLPLVLLLWACFLLRRTSTSEDCTAAPRRNRRSAVLESLCHRISLVNRCMARKSDDELSC